MPNSGQNIDPAQPGGEVTAVVSLTDIVPNFNGDTDVNKFIKSVEQFKALTLWSETRLLELVKSKLVGMRINSMRVIRGGRK